MKHVATALASLFAACALLTGGRAEEVRVYRLWPKASLVDLAASHVSRFDKGQAKYVRYFDLAAVAPANRPLAMQVLALALNSLSRHGKIALPQAVPSSEGALAWADVSLYKIDPAALDRLGELGSGPAPFPEPYYHLTADVVEKAEDKEPYTAYEETRTWSPQYGGYVIGRRAVTRYRATSVAKKVKKVLWAPHVGKATALGLSALTHSDFPIFEYRWFLTNALFEPRYHELLGLDDSEASFLKLAGVDEKAADRDGAQLRGAVMFSEVAHRNRLLERTPTNRRYGRGSFHRSIDFAKSVKDSDVLKDLLNSKGVAFELIATLPNGLQGYYVSDAQGKRLDVAAADVATNGRKFLRDPQVRTAASCMNCHLAEKGWIEADDEVRALTRKSVKLLADAFDRKGDGRGERIRQKYLDGDYNELIRADQAVVEAAVRAATTYGGKSLTCAEAARALSLAIAGYLDAPVTVAQLALELGYPQAAVQAALRAEGLDPVFVLMAAGRRSRRDQIEAGYAAFATILAKGYVK